MSEHDQVSAGERLAEVRAASGCPDGADLGEWLKLCRQAVEYLTASQADRSDWTHAVDIRVEHARLTAPPRPLPREAGWYGGSWYGGDVAPRLVYRDSSGLLRLAVCGWPVDSDALTWLPSDEPGVARMVTL